MMLLVLFPFAEVLFSGFTCVYLCGWPHVYTCTCLCVCVPTGGTHAALLLAGPGQMELQAASPLSGYQV